MELKEGKKHTCGLRRPFGVAGMTKVVQCLGTPFFALSKRPNGEPSSDPLWGIFPKELKSRVSEIHLCTHLHRGIVHKG